MHTRLLSFLSDIENALAADDPSPGDGGSWDNTRTVNYHLGLARLCLGVRPPSGASQARGAVLLQSYALADGTPCLKAVMSWTGSDNTSPRAIYSKPNVNWKAEARKIAAEWMGGPPAQSQASDPAAEPAAAIAS